MFVADLHCDLLSYLTEAPFADPLVGGKIGCNIPDLIKGNVKVQVMAIYTATGNGSVNMAMQQACWFQKLLEHYGSCFSHLSRDERQVEDTPAIKIITAIENASGICETDDNIKQAFINFQKIISLCGKPLYLGLTHHGENRFGGGNSTKVGLKEDGKLLINFLSKEKIAIDFSHTSDYLAYDILNYINKYNIDIPLLASHSNFRSVYNHPRNLPDDIAKEIIRKKGLIGINFLRAFLNPDKEEALFEHLQYGLELGAENQLCFGADYFYCDSHPDQTRKPFFFMAHEDASKYPSILDTVSHTINEKFAQKLSSENFLKFFKNY